MALLVGLSAVSGCGSDLAQACPAMAYGSSLTVQLDDAWATGVTRTVEVDCGASCSVGPVGPLLLDVPPTDPFPHSPSTPGGSLSQERVDPGSAQLPFDDTGAVMASLVFPSDPLTLRVREGDVVVVEDAVSPDWVRVGGSAECGGPTEATVVVPVP